MEEIFFNPSLPNLLFQVCPNELTLDFSRSIYLPMYYESLQFTKSLDEEFTSPKFSLFGDFLNE